MIKAKSKYLILFKGRQSESQLNGSHALMLDKHKKHLIRQAAISVAFHGFSMLGEAYRLLSTTGHRRGPGLMKYLFCRLGSYW